MATNPHGCDNCAVRFTSVFCCECMPRVLVATIQDELDCSCADGSSFEIIWNSSTEKYEGSGDFGCDDETITLKMYCDEDEGWRFDINITGCDFEELNAVSQNDVCVPFSVSTLIVDVPDCCGAPTNPSIRIDITE